MKTTEHIDIREERAKAVYQSFDFYMSRPEHRESLEFISSQNPWLGKLIRENNERVRTRINLAKNAEHVGTLILPLVYYRKKDLYKNEGYSELLGSIRYMIDEEKIHNEYMQEFAKTVSDISDTLRLIDSVDGSIMEYTRLPQFEYTMPSASSINDTTGETIVLHRAFEDDSKLNICVLEIGAFSRAMADVYMTVSGMLVDHINTNASNYKKRHHANGDTSIMKLMLNPKARESVIQLSGATIMFMDPRTITYDDMISEFMKFNGDGRLISFNISSYYCIVKAMLEPDVKMLLLDIPAVGWDEDEEDELYHPNIVITYNKEALLNDTTDAFDELTEALARLMREHYEPKAYGMYVFTDSAYNMLLRDIFYYDDFPIYADGSIYRVSSAEDLTIDAVHKPTS